MRRHLPSGTVTFLFTDVEGSTRLLHALGPERYADALAEHRRVVRAAIAANGGVEVDTQGDAFFVAFPTAPDAAAAAQHVRDALDEGPTQVRMGLHTGAPLLTDEGYVGPDVHRAARIAAVGHGGQILASAATAALLPDLELRDLGEHRLKDLARAERIYQLDTGEHPPLRTISNTNLPHAASSFVGREQELQEVLAGIREGRLLTLTGPGGTGKTRLALEAAGHVLPDFPGGVFWVSLAALHDPRLVPGEIERTIGAKQPLAEAIGPSQMLLVLDNVEQVIEVGRDLASILEACRGLRLLVTSRELLRVRGEVEYRVRPLADPDAVSLFVERAGMTDPHVPELCRRLDNLPLAVELAAARARLLSPQQMLERLGQRLDLFRGGRDAEARQATLRATIEWSHDLLTTEEQRLFANLAVFRGGSTLEAAEQVADADLETLASLVDKSLVVRDEERFRMLESIRAYALEHLEKSGAAEAIRARHLAHVLAVAERWYAERFASEPQWLAGLEAENDNIRAALDWAHVHAPAQEILLAGAIAPLWSLNAQSLEAADRLRSTLEQWSAPDAARARAVTHLAELDDDVEGLEAALRLWRELGDAEGEAMTLEAIGWAHDTHGDYAAAERAHRQSLELRDRIGSPEAHGLSARAGLCHVLVARGETRRATGVAEELLELGRRHDSALMEQLALHFLADCPLVDGDFPESERRYRLALACARRAGLVGRAIDEVLGIAMSLAGQGRSAEAVSLAACAHSKQSEIGRGSDHWWSSMQERLLGAARAQLAPDELQRAESEGAASTFDEVVDRLVEREHV